MLQICGTFRFLWSSIKFYFLSFYTFFFVFGGGGIICVHGQVHVHVHRYVHAPSSQRTILAVVPLILRQVLSLGLELAK